MLQCVPWEVSGPCHQRLGALGQPVSAAAACCSPQSDPLKETLDGVLPLVEEGAEALGTVPTSVPQSIEEARPCCYLQRRINPSARVVVAGVAAPGGVRGVAAPGLPVH